jgi:predicted ester cyclase
MHHREFRKTLLIWKGGKMSVEENKTIVRRLLKEIINQRNLALLDEVVASDCVFHGAGGQEVSGTEVVKQLLTTFFDAFGNFHVTIEDMVGEGDKVVVRFTESGRHQGEFKGIAPTGKEVTWAEIAIFRLTGGRIVEGWMVEDMLGLMQQLGAIPTQ